MSAETPYRTKAEAAKRLRICVRTLENLIARGDGPPYRRHGRRVLFTDADLDAWSLGHVVQPGTNQPNS